MLPIGNGQTLPCACSSPAKRHIVWVLDLGLVVLAPSVNALFLSIQQRGSCRTGIGGGAGGGKAGSHTTSCTHSYLRLACGSSDVDTGALRFVGGEQDPYGRVINCLDLPTTLLLLADVKYSQIRTNPIGLHPARNRGFIGWLKRQIDLGCGYLFSTGQLARRAGPSTTRWALLENYW